MKLAAAVAAAAAMLGAAQASQAATVLWTLSNGTFDDGGAFSGTFSVDTATGAITQWNVSTGNLYDSSFTLFGGADDNGGGPTFRTLIFPIFEGVFSLTNIPLSGPGTVAHLTGSEEILAFGIFPSGGHLVTDGQAVGVLASAAPEPAAWSLMILGAGLAGATLRLKRRLAAAG